MATGIELATAYISLVGSTAQLKKDINKAFDEADKSSARAGKRIGENLSAGLGGTKNSAARAGKDAAAEYERALKSSLRGEKIGRMIGEPIGKGIGLAIKGGIGLAAVGATAAVGTLVASLTKGFTRLKNIDNAKFKLEALGNSAADVKKIMDNANKAVKGTAFGLDAAATTASTAVAAGVAPGTDLTAYLTNVADAAAIAGVSMEEMGSVFNKVQTNGKAMTDDLQMLADRGLPVFTWLQKQYGVTGEALQKMVEDGKVSSADFQAAIGQNIGGAAQKMGQSFEGAMANLDAALGRLGASLLGIPFNEASGGLGTITTALDNLNAWVNQNQAGLIDFWSALGKAAVFTAQSVLQGASDILEAVAGLAGGIGNVQGAITKFQAWQADIRGDHDQADQLRAEAEEYFSWGENLQTVSDKLQDVAANAGDFYGKLDDWSERTKNAATLTKALGDAVATVDDNQILIKDNTPEVNKSLEDLGVKLETLPSGDVKLVPNTPEAQKIIDAFLGKNTPTAPVPVPVEPDTAAADVKMQSFIDKWKSVIISPSVNPGGGGPTNPLTAPLGGTSSAGGPTNPLDVIAGQFSGAGGGPGGPVGNMPSGMVGAQGSQQPGAAFVDNIASQFGLTKTSGSRPGDDGYHGSGQAGDYSGSVADMQRFAAYMSQNFGSSLAEIIFDAKGWAGNVKNGQNTGAFGNVYTMDQAGDHSDHVHVAWAGFASGGAARGPGGPTGDKIPAWLSNGEHVLTAAEVDAMGGQANVYAFRNALHRKSGGAIYRDLLKLGSSGGGGGPIGKGDGADFGERTDTGRPRDQQWGDFRLGVIPGERNTPRGPWKDHGTFAPWWFWGDRVISSEWGNISGLKPRSPEWENRRDVMIGPNEGNGRQPGAYDPDVKIPTQTPTPGRGSMWYVPPPEQSLGMKIGLYDGGGPWPTGTLGLNATGEDEWVLTPEQIEELKKQGIDPATMQHGMGAPAGLQPGPTPDQLGQMQPQGGDGAELMGGSRTEGYIPAGAGSTAVAGESFMSGIYNMGAEVINGIIDQAASAASSAAGMALTAGTFGAGAAGAPAASAATAAAIGMGTQAAKRGVEYGAQMLGILTDSFIEQATPFGAPRILSTDPTAFMPQQALMEAATTSLEKAFQPQQPQGPETPEPVTAGASAHVNELEPGTGNAPQFNTTVNATVKDVNELNRTLNDQQRLNIMQYSGRP